jgi:hypothetical protein
MRFNPEKLLSWCAGLVPQPSPSDSSGAMHVMSEEDDIDFFTARRQCFEIMGISIDS